MNSRMIFMALLISVLLCGPISLAHAQSDEQDVADYWPAENEEELGKDNSVSVRDGHRWNNLLKTDNIYVKIGWFAGQAVVAYLLAWIAFAILVKDRSPARVFSISFMGFTSVLFLAGLVCFSEYALAHGYDKQKAYLVQLQWVYIVTAALVWMILSYLATRFLEGRN
jgi:hypothetical protein